MAFSTQKDFFHVPFMNETVDYECKKACVKLKSYDSTIDDRSWALDELKQSKFLTDLVTCQTPIGCTIERVGQRECIGDPLTGGGVGGGVRGGYGIGGPFGEAFLAKHGITPGDSLLDCANENLAKIEEILNEKRNLEKKLDISNERLKTAKEENQKIKSIMNEKFDSSHSKDFYNKIQKLVSAGKLNKSDENELLQIYKKCEDVNKAYEVMETENCYLSRLLEKLSQRATLDDIKGDPENSTDVAYLQNQVNELRKEVIMLRQLEDDSLKSKQDQNKNKTRLSDKDAENLKAILKERNLLREKCKTFKELEKKVRELQKKALAADHLSGSLSSDLDSQSRYISDVEEKMKEMQLYFEDQMQKAKFNEEILKCKIDEMRDDLVRAKCEASKTDCLQMEIGCLKNEILKRDIALNDYDCQYKQLMFVIAELQCNAVQNLHDTETQTCTEYLDDLAFFASATLSEIMKELNRRKDIGGEIGGWPGNEGGVGIVVGHEGGKEECCLELEKLKQAVKQLTNDNAKLQKQLNEGVPKNCEELCADALKKLKASELENEKLRKAGNDHKNENERLSISLQNQTGKLDTLTKRLEKVDKEMDNNIKDTAAIGQDLQQSIQLVQDISDMQMKNQQLSSAVNAINSRDDQKIIDDLRRQLLEEQEKNKKWQQENENLKKELAKRAIDVKSLPKATDKDEAGKGSAEAGKETVVGGKGTDEAGKGTTEALKGTTEAVKGTTEAVKGTTEAVKGTDEAGKGTTEAVKGTAEAGKGSAEAGQGLNETEKGSTEAGEETAEVRKETDQARKGTDEARKPETEKPKSEIRAEGDADQGHGDITGGQTIRPFGPGVGGKLPRSGGAEGQTTAPTDPYEQFINNNAANISMNLQAGNALVKEIRSLLDAFIQECGFCFCKNSIPKSKFYALCHKILHNGFQSLAFKELVYLHKKIYMAADRMHSGYLLKMILAEQEGGNNRESSDRFKCCNCRSALCCSNSEEMLREKVCKLERDIEMAKEYLDNMSKTFPQQSSRKKSYKPEDIDKSQTYRSGKTHSKCSSKQIQNLKARILKCSELLR